MFKWVKRVKILVVATSGDFLYKIKFLFSRKKKHFLFPEINFIHLCCRNKEIAVQENNKYIKRIKGN